MRLWVWYIKYIVLIDVDLVVVVVKGIDFNKLNIVYWLNDENYSKKSFMVLMLIDCMEVFFNIW